MMSKTGWTTLLVVGMCAGFVVGAAVGKNRKPEGTRRLRTVESEDKRQVSEHVQRLVESLDSFRKALAEKENRVTELERELAEVRGMLPPPLSAEEQKEQEEYNDWREKRKSRERSQAMYEKSKELRKKILQRKDPALRQQGLLELEALVKSDQAEDLLVGLTTLWRLWGFEFEKEGLKPHVLAALKYDNVEVRKAAMNCLGALCSGEEQRDTALSMLRDPSPELRLEAVWLAGNERNEEVASTLKALLQDEDNSVKKEVLDELWRHHFAYDYGTEIENVVIELSKDPELTDAAWEWMCRRGPTSAPMAQRLIEMQSERRSGYQLLDSIRRNVSDEARPIATGFCLQLVRESIEPWERQRAVEKLRELGDPSVIPELEAIARSPDAEGIEQELARTIEQLRNPGKEPRQRYF
jgi:HEAT repeat protein